MNALGPYRLTLLEIERRGRALVEFCRRVRERGGRAQVEEDEDIPVLRAMWLTLQAATRRGRP